MLPVPFGVELPKNMVRRVQPHIWWMIFCPGWCTTPYVIWIFLTGRTTENKRGLVCSSLVPELPYLPAYIRQFRPPLKRNTEMHGRHGNRAKEIDDLAVKRLANILALSVMSTRTDYCIAVPCIRYPNINLPIEG